METENKPDQLLINILTTKRADQSAGDTNFRLWLHSTLQSLKVNIEILQRGNIYVVVGSSKTLFCCHIDTCHTVAESDGSIQEINYDDNINHIFLPSNTKSACLGADDGAGIYLMLKMIQAGINGGYLFHTGEERGGLGSKDVLKHHSDILKKYDRAIAFDRPDNNEVIITQGGTACASQEAGEALCGLLNKHNLTYEISRKGVFTDTKTYIGIIPECFNIGVGYMFQHSKDEYLDYEHLQNLLEACLKIHWEAIPTIRKPATPPPLPKSNNQKYIYDQLVKPPKVNSYYKSDGMDWWDESPFKPYGTNKPSSKEVIPDLPTLDDLFSYTLEELTEFSMEDPGGVAIHLATLLSKVEGLRAETKQLKRTLGVT